MIKVAPSPYLLILPFFCLVLGMIAIFLTSLGLWLQMTLSIALIIFAVLQMLGLMQMMPKSLMAFDFPVSNKLSWKVQLKRSQKRYEAILLGSTRINSRIILLHFEMKHPRIRVYQIILPSMIGQDHFHDLLVYLKIY